MFIIFLSSLFLPLFLKFIIYDFSKSFIEMFTCLLLIYMNLVFIRNVSLITVICNLFPKLLIELYFFFQESFRFIEKLKEMYRDFQYTPVPTYTQLPHYQHPHESGKFVTIEKPIIDISLSSKVHSTHYCLLLEYILFVRTNV